MSCLDLKLQEFNQFILLADNALVLPEESRESLATSSGLAFIPLFSPAKPRLHGETQRDDVLTFSQKELQLSETQGRSHRYGWSGFNQTTFLPTFSNSAACLADRLAVTRPQLTE